MKPHKYAELIKAWADGAQIQYKSQVAYSTWMDTKNPVWNEYNDYRIKPEPKPDFKAAFKVSKEHPDWCDPLFDRMPICTQGNLLLTFDGETGHLKAAEVLK